MRWGQRHTGHPAQVRAGVADRARWGVAEDDSYYLRRQMDRRRRVSEGVPTGEPVVEVRLYPAEPPRAYSGATVEWAYPSELEGRALDPGTALRQAIDHLLDALQGHMGPLGKATPVQ